MDTRTVGWSSYFTPPAELDRLGLVCLGIGAQLGAVAPVRDRVLDHYGLVLVASGGGWYGDDEGRHAVPAGSMIRLFPGVRHSYGSGGQGWSEQWVLLRGSGLSVHESLGSLDREAPVVSVSDRDAVLRLLARLRAGRHGAGGHDHARRSATCYELLLAAVPAAGPPDLAIERLTHEPGGAASIREHAQALGMTEPQLRAVVHDLTGMTPKGLVVRGRLDRAKGMLAETGLPVARIATRVGYDDPAYFARLFRQVVGVTPTVFRQRFLRADHATPTSHDGDVQ